MLQKFAMVKYGVFVAKICKHALCASTVRDIWWSPLARQLLPPWLVLIFTFFATMPINSTAFMLCHKKELYHYEVIKFLLFS